MAAPYDAQSRKRRRTISTPLVKRLVRAKSAPATDPQSSRHRLRLVKQATLTQIDFIKNLDDIDVTRISEDDANAVIAKRRTPRPAVPKFQKQDSTLTQMGWVGSSTRDRSIDITDLQSDLLAPVATTTNTESNEAEHELKTPSTSKEMASLGTGSAGSKKRARRSESHSESQDYKPAPSRKKRRVDTTAQSRTNPRRTARGSNFKPPLVIADSTDFTEVAPEILRSQAQLKTPTKRSNRIPSSQTPESLKPSTRKKVVGRRPLTELSTNAQISPPKSSSLLSTKKTSPRKSKICTLKLPPKAALPRVDRQENDKSDIWSLHATSSTRNSSPPLGLEGGTDNIDRSTSPSQKVLVQPEQVDDLFNDTQKSLPDLDTIFRNPSSRRKNKIQQQPNLEIENPPLNEHLDQIELQTYSVPNPINVLPDLNEILAYNDDDDNDSDLGSPVRNDTQFVRGMHERISSPSRNSGDGDENAEASTASARKASPKHSGLLGSSRATSPIVLSPLPAPRLVRSPAAHLKRQPSDSTISTLPSVSTPQLSSSPRRAVERVKIVQVPLNDTAEYQKSSSSPALPPTLWPLHGHILPASIPHPSQISTQAPSTQGYYPTTPRSISRKTTNQSLIEQIAVSDSSSVPKLLSQLPRSDNTNKVASIDRLGDDGDESMDDLEDDLNPSTYPISKAISNEKIGKHGGLGTQDDITQSPTQTSHRRAALRRQTTTQSSPVITSATTRSQRDAKLEIIDISSSSQIVQKDQSPTDDEITPKAANRGKRKHAAMDGRLEERSKNAVVPDALLSSPTSSSVHSPSPPRPLRRKYSPIPGFDNDTQSDFTQNGHVTAAYIHRAREDGLLPLNYTPKPYQVQKRGNGRN